MITREVGSTVGTLEVYLTKLEDVTRDAFRSRILTRREQPTADLMQSM